MSVLKVFTAIAAALASIVDAAFQGKDTFNHGFTTYADKDTALNSGLATTKDNKVYLGVDTTTVLNPSDPKGRTSVRLQSLHTFGFGLLVADFEHVPAKGCGTRPALLARRGKKKVGIEAAGKGCGVIAPSGTFGEEVNGKRGGVWAAQVEGEGVKMWYLPRENVPEDLKREGEVDTGTWPAPMLNFGAGDCDVKKAFRKMHRIIDITFCGEYAGNVWNGYDNGNINNCHKHTTYDKCENFVAEKPEAFKEVYFLVNSIRTFRQNGKV
ncbi:hypothetical protein CC80DRAFT_540051 [Byssothecium circinans]|uniref:Uncharacterized protein n=1 Tax=Byssothecium circinans TaxID=147558 RepID=A0A6A5T9Z1_9PLEO|nr:hypothetical protein CC80DRAFT_540051 [Byssothecium circinans]